VLDDWPLQQDQSGKALPWAAGGARAAHAHESVRAEGNTGSNRADCTGQLVYSRMPQNQNASEPGQLGALKEPIENLSGLQEMVNLISLTALDSLTIDGWFWMPLESLWDAARCFWRA
jgi:hypothetical protein